MKIPNLYLLELLQLSQLMLSICSFLQNCHVQMKKNTTCPLQKGDVDGSAIFVHHHYPPGTRPNMHLPHKIKIKSGLLVLVRGYLCTPIVSHKQSSPNKNLLFLCAGNVHVEPYSKYLEGQQHASLFNQKMFFKFHPAKFEK